MQQCRAVGSPSTAAEKVEDETPLDEDLSAKYRRGAAICNYLAQDRCDIGYATKEVARWMSKPRVTDELRLKRLIRYLRHNPTGVYKYAWQKPVHTL